MKVTQTMKKKMYKKMIKLMKALKTIKMKNHFENLLKVYELTGDIKNIEGPITGLWEVNNNSNKLFHKQIYDENKLSQLLESCGFVKVSRWDWRDFIKDHPDYDDHSQAYFPHMDKENGIHVSLNLSCFKKD